MCYNVSACEKPTDQAKKCGPDSENGTHSNRFLVNGDIDSVRRKYNDYKGKES